MTQPQPEDFVYVIHIATTREKLWDALQNPEFTRQYWNGRVLDSDWEIGAPITVRHDYDDGTDGSGTILEYDPPRRLSYGNTTPGDSQGLMSTITTFDLKQTGEVVMLTVSSSGLKPGTPEHRGISAGWAAIMSNLKTLLESGKPLPVDEKVLAAYR